MATTIHHTPTKLTCERSQLLGECQQHFVLVVNGLREERNQLGASALLAQSQGDRRQLLDGVKAQLKQHEKSTRVTFRFIIAQTQLTWMSSFLSSSMSTAIGYSESSDALSVAAIVAAEVFVERCCCLSIGWSDDDECCWPAAVGAG